MGNKVNIKNAKCTSLSFDAIVKFAKEKEGKVTGFELDGYTGAVVKRWWGKLAISVEGISAKQQMPVFRGHDQNQIVGYSTETTNDSIFKVKGVFSKRTDAASEVIALAEEGFPWQASIGVNPKAIIELKEGASMMVNGAELLGPAEIWTESEVYETSFVPLGADDNTSATVFSNVKEVAEKGAMKPIKQEESNMELKNLTLAELKEGRPDLVALIEAESTAGHEAQLKAAKQEGAGLESARIKAVHEQTFPGHEGIVLTAMFDGKSQAGDVAMQINAANIELQKQAGLDNSGDAPAPVDEPAGDPPPKKNDNSEEGLKAKWDKDEALREEFMDDFELFKAAILPPKGLKIKELRNRGDE